MVKNSKNTIIDTLGEWFAKAPVLPKNAREMVVSVTPWFVLVFGILGVLGAIVGIGMLTISTPFAMIGRSSGIASYGNGLISSVVFLVSSVLMLVAFSGTKAHSIKGWNMLFWSECIHVVGSILAGSVIGGLLGAVITFYLLFQIKSFYKKLT